MIVDERRPIANKLTPLQFGHAAQYLLCGLSILGGRGRLKVTIPHVDDDMVDFFFHLQGDFSRALAVQAKCSLQAGRLDYKIRANSARLISSPSFYYLFARIDPVAFVVHDPLFLVPSEFVHSLFRRGNDGKAVFCGHFHLEPGSRDRWVPYRVAPDRLGYRIIEIIERLPR